MKIRIKDNSVRYRLSKSEVAALSKAGVLQAKAQFPTHSLQYTVQQSDHPAMTADFADNNVTLHVPQQQLQQWADGDEVSLEEQMELPNGLMMKLLIEKDFKCLDAESGEDQSDNYDNPNQTC